jgi:hypothetical protein
VNQNWLRIRSGGEFLITFSLHYVKEFIEHLNAEFCYILLAKTARLNEVED